MASSEAPPTKYASWMETETTKLPKLSSSTVFSTLSRMKLLPAPILSPDNPLSTDSNSTGLLELLESTTSTHLKPMFSGTIILSDHFNTAVSLESAMLHSTLFLKLDKTPFNSTEPHSVTAMVSPSTTLESSPSTTLPTSLSTETSPSPTSDLAGNTWPMVKFQHGLQLQVKSDILPTTTQAGELDKSSNSIQLRTKDTLKSSPSPNPFTTSFSSKSNKSSETPKSLLQPIWPSKTVKHPSTANSPNSTALSNAPSHWLVSNSTTISNPSISAMLEPFSTPTITNFSTSKSTVAAPVNGSNTSVTVENLTSNADSATRMSFPRTGAPSSASTERSSSAEEIKDTITFRLLHAPTSKELKPSLNPDTRSSGKDNKDPLETSMLPSLPPAVDADLLYFTISYSYYQYYYEQ